MYNMYMYWFCSTVDCTKISENISLPPTAASSREQSTFADDGDPVRRGRLSSGGALSSDDRGPAAGKFKRNSISPPPEPCALTCES